MKKLLWAVVAVGVRIDSCIIAHGLSILVVVAVSQETVKLSLKIDAATTKAHGLQDTSLLACGSTSS